MMTKLARGLSVLFLLTVGANPVSAADRLIGVQSARVMSQSMPWIAEETGIFRKYNLEFPLVDIGAAQLLIDGGVGLVRTVVGGDADLVFIAGIKNQTPPPPSRDVAGGLNQKLPRIIFCRLFLPPSKPLTWRTFSLCLPDSLSFSLPSRRV